MRFRPSDFGIIAGVLVGLFVSAVLGYTVAVNVDQDPSTGDKTVTVKVNESQRDGVPTTTLKVPEKLVDEAVDKTEDGLHREDKYLLSPQQKDRISDKADQIRKTQKPLPTAGASAGFPGCVTRFVRNQSSRNGIRPQWQVLHYTVSRNVPGWSDVNAIVALFDRPSAQASSNFIIDAEGHCAYVVPVEAKSWTQAAANPFSVSYEIINSGSESALMGAAGYARLKLVMTEVQRRTGIPRTAGGNQGCVPTRKGVVQHADFGICGGGHHDINPFSKANVIRVVGSPAPKPVTSHAKKLCQELNRARKRKKFNARSTAVKKALAKAHYVCSYGPPGSIKRR